MRGFPMSCRLPALASGCFGRATDDAGVALRIDAEESRMAFGDAGTAPRLAVCLCRRAAGVHRDQAKDGGGKETQQTRRMTHHLLTSDCAHASGQERKLAASLSSDRTVGPG